MNPIVTAVIGLVLVIGSVTTLIMLVIISIFIWSWISSTAQIIWRRFRS